MKERFRMQDFTVITYFTPDFQCFESGLKEDCRRLGYPIHSHQISHCFDDVIMAFDYKIEFILEMVKQYGQVLWLDVECRIVQPLPVDWTSPLISVYRSGLSNGSSSGVLMLDESHLEFIELWHKYARRYPSYPDDFVLDFLCNETSFEFRTVPLEFYDRCTSSPIARGLWSNEHTIIQHPTLNRWPAPMKYRKAFNGRSRSHRSATDSISRQRKALFYRNFAGDFEQVTLAMQTGSDREYRDSEWVFVSETQRYAPELYWPEFADDYTAKPRSFEQSHENFKKLPRGQSFRESAIQGMRLESQDAQRYCRDGKAVRTGRFVEYLRRLFLRR
jgi:hypothetical protein